MWQNAGRHQVAVVACLTHAQHTAVQGCLGHMVCTVPDHEAGDLEGKVGRWLHHSPHAHIPFCIY